MEHRFKYKPKHLPHWDFGEVAQTITYRLADSLSPKEYDKILSEMVTIPIDQQNVFKRVRIENWLHKNRYGSCCLQNHEAAEIIINAWYFHAGDWYDLYEWVVMGNHVHVLIRQYEGHRIGDIVHSWKSFTSKQIAARLNIPQPVWLEGYWDRMIRDAEHFRKVQEYIVTNPAKSGFENWPYVSSVENRNTE